MAPINKLIKENAVKEIRFHMYCEQMYLPWQQENVVFAAVAAPATPTRTAWRT
jgi:hypothetical protein